MPPQQLDWSIVAETRAKEKKTHVSFPQLKYPSFRNKYFIDPVQWRQTKAMDDGAEGIWRVHDKLYDLTPFIQHHPGGGNWLELTKGTDITEAFEAHHINPTAEKMLNKFYVREAKTPRNSPFTFKDDGFYRTLKKAVNEELKKLPKDIPKSSDRITDGLFVALLCSSSIACWVSDYWAGWLCYIVASIMLTFLTIACHNYIHRRTNWRMYLFNMSMWSYRDFRVSHVISHHLYTNTLWDLEISCLEPVLYLLPRKDKPIYAKFGFIAELFLFPLVFIFSFIKRFHSIYIGTEKFNWDDITGLILPLIMWVTSGAPILHVLYNWVWIVSTGSLLFFLVGVNAAHHHPDVMKDGDEPKSETPDWGEHQLEAVLDRKDVNSNTFTVLTLFGDHALHHLFPTLDHGVLKNLYPIFLEHCDKFQANYHVRTQLKAVIGQIKEHWRTQSKSYAERLESKSKYLVKKQK